MTMAINAMTVLSCGVVFGLGLRSLSVPDIDSVARRLAALPIFGGAAGVIMNVYDILKSDACTIDALARDLVELAAFAGLAIAIGYRRAT